MGLNPGFAIGADSSVERCLRGVGDGRAGRLAPMESNDDFLGALRSVPRALDSFRVRQYFHLLVGLSHSPQVHTVLKRAFRILCAHSQPYSESKRKRLHQAGTANATVSFLRTSKGHTEREAVQLTSTLADEAAAVIRRRAMGDTPDLRKQAKEIASRAGCGLVHLPDLAELSGKRPASIRLLVSESRKLSGVRIQSAHRRPKRSKN